MWNLHVEYTSETYISDVASIFIQGHMPIMSNICISVLVVILLIVLSSHEMYILT